MPITTENLQPRQRVISRLLRDLRPHRNGHRRAVPIRTIPLIGQSAIVIGACDQASEQHRDWRFTTFSDRLLAQYFEEWEKVAGSEQFRLCQACFHIYDLEKQSASGEIIAIHTEPRITALDRLSRYKFGPHLHLEAAGYPLSKAHFPLNLGHLDAVMTSIDSLTLALKAAVEIVQSEVCERF